MLPLSEVKAEQQLVMDRSRCESCQWWCLTCVWDAHKSLCKRYRSQHDEYIAAPRAFSKRKEERSKNPLMARTDRQACRICYTFKRQAFLQPCQHLCVCAYCWMLNINESGRFCPICEVPVDGVLIAPECDLKKAHCPSCREYYPLYALEAHREKASCCRGWCVSSGTDSEDSVLGPTVTEDAPNASPPQWIARRCRVCKTKQERLVVTKPCAHRVMCESCAVGRTMCPEEGCGQEIKESYCPYMS